MKRLPLLCPQLYDGTTMLVDTCTKCSVGWSKELGKCTVHTGCEHLPLVSEEQVPVCPIQDRCQHQVQSATDPCVVRARGLICESALALAVGELAAAEHPLSFHAATVATVEELEQRGAAHAEG